MWLSDFAASMVRGLTVTLLGVVFFAWVLAHKLPLAFAYALGTAIPIGLYLGMVFGASWPTILSQFYLAGRHRLPWRLIRFLEDARARNVLRTVGPVYQFRHAKLQDRLAAVSPGS